MQIRLIVSRCEKDLGAIKEAYIDEYKKSLAGMVKDECCSLRLLSMLSSGFFFCLPFVCPGVYSG